ncbi:latent-transforming growth factor beta-binding protein 4-like isoform X3 [Polyodon spathula]|uniref:latent-transforming growth factor beta-binding protein 4-like isoform X3 n=1 Tax=Polyodon spathula TaxID=7913 RepID=UPI001B7DB6A6|nr:latent-transforming growth factor beta-binding protein 4-like isoform X3 [Polyodon spathula]
MNRDMDLLRSALLFYFFAFFPSPARNQNPAGERIKVLFTPTICKVRCIGGRCTNHCERGNVTTVYSSERGHSAPGDGFRVFLCPLLCQNGGICMQKDRCLCPPNFTGKFCHIPVSSSTNEIEGAAQNEAASSNKKGLTQSVYTLPLHSHQSQQSGGSEVVKVHVQHPLEVSVNIHQVQRVREGPVQEQGDASTHRRVPVPRIQAQTIRGDSSYSESSGFGYCFQEVRNGQCSSPLPGLRTQEICCLGQGKAWGISECALCTSNQGSGAGVEGGCPKGFERINGTQCVDVNECSLPGFCQNGECINTRGSYSCVCKTGYILDASQGRCISHMVISELKGQCYRILKMGFCTLPILRDITKQICCCSRVGKAWGRTCERCPPFGSEEFKEICPAGPGYHYSASSVKINQERQTPVAPPRDQKPPLTLNVGNEREVRLPPRTERPVQLIQPVRPVQPVQTSTVTTITHAATRAPEVRVCDLNPQICGAGRCLKQRGGTYTCLCNQGYHINPQQTRCVDVDECSLSPRPCTNGQCENTAGSYRCLCQSGFRLGPQGASCTDTDECRQSPSPCTNARCENTPGSYRCVCAAGYQLDHQGAECTDINECENALTCPGQECVNSAGSFQCVRCQPGYKLQNGRCTDVNECSLSPRPCTNGQCENTAGSYRCLCQSGFRLGPQGASCTDIDECRLTPRPCSIGQCENTAGSYRCVCPIGYKLNSQATQCVDVDECSLSPRPCTNGQCENTAGSYRCLCQSGFRLGPQGASCTDTDECRQSPSPCTNARCENTPGSYRCVCAAGYQLDHQGAECTDINECENAAACPGQECINSAGSFQCVRCQPGYKLQNGRCTDVDECSLSPRPCTNGQCENTAGSYRCLCPTGFRLGPQGASCTDTDECRQSPSPCTNARCENTPGSYRCVCAAGYQLDHQGAECTDINECENALTCPGQECVNSAGSFQCVRCQPGYKLQNGRCTDVNECSLSPRPCTNGQCENTAGSYRCLCQSGFRLGPQGASCTDIDECRLTPRPCSIGQCENTAGSYRCVCPIGYRLNSQATQCVDADECRQSPSPCTNARCENTPGSYRCVCAAGYQLDHQGAECTDINECENALTCPGQECVNSAGSFQCVRCQPGYQLQNGRCTDVDECRGLSVCGTNGQCLNTDGSFRCDCKIGFRSDSSGRQCRDVDECARPELCQDGSCTNTLGSFECACQPGFATNPEKTACLDVDECAESRGAVCGPRRCENTIGSFHCITSCEPGHRVTASGDCVDINECANNTVCGDHAFCQNLIGSYQCLCDQGYEAGRNGQTCVDVNECDSMQGACGAARCENVEGSFLCICGRDSEEFDPRTGQCISRNGEAQRLPTGGAPRPEPSLPRSDVRECYYNTRDANVCQNVLKRNTTLQECCCTVGEAWGVNCQLTPCPAPGTAEYQSVCPSGKGYVTSALGSFSYKDVDECTLFSAAVCKNGVCVNTIPGYSCYCPNGYYYDQTQLECVDNDECLEEESCLGGSCVNTMGSYYCSCESPLILDAAQRECIANISQSADENLAYCWQELGEDLICNRPLLDRQITYTECCCLYGLAWGIECALCPAQDSDDYEALCDVLRSPAYGPPDEPYAGEYGPGFRGEYEPPYSTDTFAEPPPRGRTPDYLRPGRYEDYPSRGGRLPSYGSRSRSAASYGPPEESPYRRSGPSQSYDLGDFEPELPYASEPRPPFGRAEPQVDPSYESRRGRYRPLSPQSAGPPFEPDEPSAPWLQYRPRGTAPYPEYPDRPLGGIRRETYESRYEQYESLSAEECGILHGCENGRCIRVPEGYTCDCYDGYHLDITTMTCRDINECEEADEPSIQCVNGQCLNTDGSYQCVCLRGFVMSRQRNYCIPARPGQ